MSLVSILLGFQFYCMAIAADSSSPTGLPLATDWVTAGVAAVLETSTAAAVVASATVAVIAAADSIITAAVRGSTSVCVAPAKCFVSYHSSISLAQKLPAYKAATRIVLLLSSLGGHCYPCSALAMDGAGCRRDLVTGARGQTGQHVFRKLLAMPGYVPVGTVCLEDSHGLEGSSGIGAFYAASSPPVSPESVVVCDIAPANNSVLDGLMKDCDALFVCTSAKPAPTGEVDEASGRPKFGFPNGNPDGLDRPEESDRCRHQEGGHPRRPMLVHGRDEPRPSAQQPREGHERRRDEKRGGHPQVEAQGRGAPRQIRLHVYDRTSKGAAPLARK